MANKSEWVSQFKVQDLINLRVRHAERYDHTCSTCLVHTPHHDSIVPVKYPCIVIKLIDELEGTLEAVASALEELQSDLVGIEELESVPIPVLAPLINTRQLVYDFLTLPYHRRCLIATNLGIPIDHNPNINDLERFRKVVQEVNRLDLVKEFEQEVNKQKGMVKKRDYVP